MSKQIDIIIPIYNEEDNIKHLYDEIQTQATSLAKYSFCYIFVNDGSTDRSLDVLKELARNNKCVKIIDLTRNFGKEIALTSGLDASRADVAIFIDADLQHPPMLIPKLIEKWENGNILVTCLRKDIKKQPLLRKIGSLVFYWILNKMSNIKFTPKSTDYRLIDKKVIDVLKKFTEKNRMFRGLIDWVGYKADYVEFEAPERNIGKARYSYRKLVNLAVNSIASFSIIPLKLAAYLGLFISAVSIILLLIMIIVRFILKSPFFSSISFVVVGNTLLIGVVLVCLGLLALYIGQIHSEVINRPLYVIKEKINFDE